MTFEEFLDGGALNIYLIKTPNIPFSQKLKFMCDISYGMLHLSKQNIIHKVKESTILSTNLKDLAARNVLLDGLLNCKVADFGLSRLVESSSGFESYLSQSDTGPIKWYVK